MKTVARILAAVLIVLSNGLFAQNIIRLDSVVVALGDSFEVPVYLASNEDVAFIQIMVEYDTNYIKLEAPNVRLGADAGAMQLGLMNANLTLSPEDTVANRSFLFQLTSGGTNSVSGTDLEIARLVFKAVSLFPGQTRIHIDGRANHSALSTINLVDIPASQIEYVDSRIIIGDNIPPQCSITFPADSTELEMSEITITGIASDSGGAGLSIVELSFDSGSSFFPAEMVNGSFENWQYKWLPGNPGDYELLARATDADSNVSYSNPPVLVTVVQQNPKLSIPTNLEAQVGATIDIPVLLENVKDVGFIQTTVAWDSLALRLDEVLPGNDASSFSVGQINRDLPFAPYDPAMNAQALFQLTGNGIDGLTGKIMEIAILRFKVVGLADSTRPIIFDPLCEHTYFSTTALVDVCSPDLTFKNGKVKLVALDAISGAVLYYSHNKHVAGVKLGLTGPIQSSTETDAAGYY